MADKPVTREEKYLAYLTGDYTGEIPKPITRKEKYLYELCLKGIGGEISPEEIKAAVNEYLEKNPVKPGATTEQAQQIEQNKTDVALLKEKTGSLKEDLGNKLDKYKYSANKANPSLFVDGTLNVSTGVVYSTTPFATSDYISVDNHSKAFIGCFKNSILSYKAHRYCFYDSNKVFITGSDASDYLIEIPNTAKYIRFSIANNQYLQSTMFAFSDSITDFIPYSATEIIVPQKYKDLLPYKGKTVLFYGDSYTEFGNTDPYAGYQGLVKDNLGIDNVISRGIGGQRILWNNTTFYANSDGSFNSRNNGTAFSTEPPTGTTEHYGSFCSWDRITTMIPESIKNTIDYIVIFGGTNDFGAWGDTIGETYTWLSEDNIDKAWAASSEYSKFNGDFDISKTFKGAVASMIVKMQTWCPDAKLVVCTPCGGRTNVKGGVLTAEPTNNINKTLRDYANAIIEVCERFGVYYVDVNADSGINIFNSDKYIYDGIHPNEAGRKKIANCISNKMYNY
jgi:lysophospholipase L1-like esterase